MRSLRSVGLIVAALSAAQALAATNVAYRLQLGGDNKVADWKAGTKQLFVPGNEADGQNVFKGNLLTWSVVADVTGDTYGAANLVFSVELYRNSVAPENLETNAVFRSTVNDGTGTDPNASAAFAVSYNIAGKYGRLIDKRSEGGPRLEPIFTYPTAEPGKLIGMGAGYKEWKRAGGDNTLLTSPGVGMTTMINGAAGLGVVPVAEGQIDMSLLPDGVYVLRVVPGTGNNVLRGDLAMAQTVDRPAFALAATSAAGDELSFNLTNVAPCQGIVARHIFYNQSAWDGNNAAANAADDAAIATDKEALLPGGVAAFKNYISYNRGINGLMFDICGLPHDPVVGQDVYFFVGNDSNTLYWPELGVQPTVSVRAGAGVNGSDRVTFIFPNNAVPNSRWLMTVFVSDANGGSLGLPAEDFSYFGLAMGESGNSAANTQVDATDINGAKNNQRSLLNPAPIDFRYDFNRDKKVDGTDQNIAKNHPTTFVDRLQLITAP